MTYCATKAALKMAGDVVGAETQAYPELKGRDIRVMDYAPGVLKTDMQKEIRSMTEEQFPNVARFIELHDNGILVEPEDSAKQALAFMQTDGGPAFVAERFA